MKTKRVNRYYCEFCKKSGCSAYHMRRHEERCTLNPNRVCGMEHEVTTTPQMLADAIASIPDVNEFKKDGNDGFGEFSYFSIPDDLVEKTIADLTERLDGCPVCVYAALRQAGWAGIVRDKFDLKERIASYWSDVNMAEERASYGY